MSDSKWHNLMIGKSLNIYETEKAALIRIPKGKYKDWTFWIPLKLVHKKGNSKSIQLSFTDDFNFKVFRKHEESVDEVELSASELLDCFKNKENKT